MATPVDICNAALARIGKDPIPALDGTISKVAQDCATLFPLALAYVLEDGKFRFATERRSVAADAAAPAWGPSHRFALPSTVLLVLEVGDGVDPVEGWQREGGYVLADFEGPAKLRCVELVEDTGRWTAGAVEALAAYLAFRLCSAITDNRSLAAELWQEYRVTLARARAADGLQGRARSFGVGWAARARG